MFYAKFKDDDNDELPRYGEEEEGEGERPDLVVEEAEELIIEETPSEVPASRPAKPAPARRKSKPARKAKPARRTKAKKSRPKKKGGRKAKARGKAGSKKKGRRRKR